MTPANKSAVILAIGVAIQEHGARPEGLHRKIYDVLSTFFVIHTKDHSVQEDEKLSFEELKSRLVNISEYAQWLEQQNKKLTGPMKFRTGSHNPRNVYLEGSNRDTDIHVGVFFDHEMAKYVVGNLNTPPASEVRTGQCPACHHSAGEHDYVGCNYGVAECTCQTPFGAKGV